MGILSPGSDPQILHKPVIGSPEDLKRAPRPNFRKSGIMPVMIHVRRCPELSGRLLNPIFLNGCVAPLALLPICAGLTGCLNR